MNIPEDTTIADVLLRHAERMPDKLAYRFLASGDAESANVTFGDLAERARRLAAHLGAGEEPGSLVLLLLESGLPFIEALFGCMLAGLVPVAVDLPRPNRSTDRLQAIVRHSGARAFLTSSAELPRVEKLIEAVPGLGDLRRYLSDDSVAASAAAAAGLRHGPGATAFIQYTSGSTSDPKGVVITHRNLIANQFQIRAAFGHDERTRFLGWLPMFHDMGLVGNVLQPLFLGVECTLMPPAAFVQRPLRWLTAITKYRATTSGGPNFAFDHCVKRIADSDVDSLDLSSWRVTFNGAEPIRAVTLRAFADKFGRAGFDPTSFLPCYGLAEATLFVSGHSRFGRAVPATLRVSRADLEQGRLMPTGSTDPSQSVELVSSGPPSDSQTVLVMETDTGRPCADGEVGEIWIAGPNVSAEYFRNPAATEMLLSAHAADREGLPARFLRTGDLGAFWKGELYVAGRIKNLIIVRGRKIYAEDIEQLVSRSHDLFQPNRCAAFAVRTNDRTEAEQGDEGVVIIQEAARRPRTADEVKSAIDGARQLVAANSDIVPHEIILVRPGGIPLTTSGKIRHAEIRAAYLDGRVVPFTPNG